MDLAGIHHVTAVTADIRANKRFYTDVLGMRLVKRSVNQDDVRAYHLFYADAVGTPGTDLTFFDWRMPREQRGTHALVRTHLRVNGAAALDWWADRLRTEGVAVDSPAERDGRATLDFEDPEGQRLSFVDDAGTGDEGVTWDRSPVPAELRVRGLGPVVMSVPRIEPTDRVLTSLLNMTRAREYALPDTGGATVVVYQMGDAAGPHAELHVAIQPDLPRARLGAGGVHHVAFRTPTAEQYDAWNQRLADFGIPNSGPIDRYYFRSLYFREPNGILFEIATDGPGFAVDEDPATLGEHVALPPFLELHRSAIVANLKPID
jgi:glyoxalase family protein